MNNLEKITCILILIVLFVYIYKNKKISRINGYS